MREERNKEATPTSSTMHTNMVLERESNFTKELASFLSHSKVRIHDPTHQYTYIK